MVTLVLCDWAAVQKFYQLDRVCSLGCSGQGGVELFAEVDSSCCQGH